jgi:hypothetical protein
MANPITGWNVDGANQAQKTGNPMVYNTPTPASYGVGNQTYLVADIIGGLIVHNGTGNATGTVPTAAALAAAILNPQVGDTIECLIINGGASGNITVTANTGATFDANQVTLSQVIQPISSKYVVMRFTNTTPGSQAYVIYS